MNLSKLLEMTILSGDPVAVGTKMIMFKAGIFSAIASSVGMLAYRWMVDMQAKDYRYLNIDENGDLYVNVHQIGYNFTHDPEIINLGRMVSQKDEALN